MMLASAKELSRSVADAVASKLPLEMTEPIFEQLMADKMRSMKTFLARHAYGEIGWTDKQLVGLMPPYLQPGYVGADVARLMLQHLYKKCFYREEHVIRIVKISHFLAADPFHQDLTPNLYISRLVIEWDAMRYPSYTPAATTACLQSLAETEYLKRPYITLKLKWFDVGDLHMFPTSVEVEALKVAYAALLAEGHHVTLVHDNIEVPDLDTLVQQWEALKAKQAEEDCEEEEEIVKLPEAVREACKWPSRVEVGRPEKVHLYL
jgi:hypothetical protein